MLCLLSAAAGAAGVLAAGEQGGWLGSNDQLVVVRTSSAPSTTVILDKPVLAKGFQPQQIFAERAAGVVTVYAYYGSSSKDPVIEQGSGVVVTRSGVIVTAAHVIVQTHGASPLETPARAVYVQFGDGDRVHAAVVGWDPYDDVGVLRVSPHQHALDPIPFDNSSAVAIGQPVAAIGSPLGDPTSLSVGVVSQISQTIPSLMTSYDLPDAIQTDAPINPGSSGGPLLNAQGQLIGINAQIRSSGEVAFQGIGFAIPVSSVERSLDQLLSDGYVPYAYLGLRTENLTPQIARHIGYLPGYGAIVVSVVPGGPAARAGLRAGTRTEMYDGQQITVGGDAIVAIDGSPVVSSAAVAALVAERLVPGEVAFFTVVNGHRKSDIVVVLGTRPP